MTSSPTSEAHTLQIMVYGARQKGIVAPSRQLSSRNYVLHFEDYDTSKRFDEFDGVIVFQGTFEHVERARRSPYMDGPIYRLRYDKDELDRRTRETQQLLGKKGFVCFVLCEPFFDGDDADWRRTDLVKLYVIEDYVYRRNFDDRVSPVTPRLSEFKRFLERFGAANAWFDPSHKVNLRRIATVGDNLVGMIIGQQMFFVPAQLPVAKPGKSQDTHPDTKEFFELLADAVVSVVKKQVLELPGWIDAYRFDKERAAFTRQTELAQAMDAIAAEIDAFRQFKWVLVRTGDELVDAVKHVLEAGFGFNVEVDEQYREDATILGDDGKPMVLVELTGVNAGVQREKVGQADYHRERAGVPETFPYILIVNTNIKNARSLEEKDQPVANEQVRHAKKLNVLVLRTLDLLRLLSLYQRGKASKSDLLRLLTTGAGWLKVGDEGWEVVDQ